MSSPPFDVSSWKRGRCNNCTKFYQIHVCGEYCPFHNGSHCVDHLTCSNCCTRNKSEYVDWEKEAETLKIELMKIRKLECKEFTKLKFMLQVLRSQQLFHRNHVEQRDGKTTDFCQYQNNTFEDDAVQNLFKSLQSLQLLESGHVNLNRQTHPYIGGNCNRIVFSIYSKYILMYEIRDYTLDGINIMEGRIPHSLLSRSFMHVFISCPEDKIKRYDINLTNGFTNRIEIVLISLTLEEKNLFIELGEEIGVIEEPKENSQGIFEFNFLNDAETPLMIQCGSKFFLNFDGTVHFLQNFMPTEFTWHLRGDLNAENFVAKQKEKQHLDHFHQITDVFTQERLSILPRMNVNVQEIDSLTNEAIFYWWGEKSFEEANITKRGENSLASHGEKEKVKKNIQMIVTAHIKKSKQKKFKTNMLWIQTVLKITCLKYMALNLNRGCFETHSQSQINYFIHSQFEVGLPIFHDSIGTSFSKLNNPNLNIKKEDFDSEKRIADHIFEAAIAKDANLLDKFEYIKKTSIEEFDRFEKLHLFVDLMLNDSSLLNLWATRYFTRIKLLFWNFFVTGHKDRHPYYNSFTLQDEGNEPNASNALNPFNDKLNYHLYDFKVNSAIDVANPTSNLHPFLFGDIRLWLGNTNHAPREPWKMLPSGFSFQENGNTRPLILFASVESQTKHWMQVRKKLTVHINMSLRLTKTETDNIRRTLFNILRIDVSSSSDAHEYKMLQNMLHCCSSESQLRHPCDVAFKIILKKSRKLMNEGFCLLDHDFLLEEKKFDTIDDFRLLAEAYGFSTSSSSFVISDSCVSKYKIWTPLSLYKGASYSIFRDDKQLDTKYFLPSQTLITLSTLKVMNAATNLPFRKKDVRCISVS